MIFLDKNKIIIKILVILVLILIFLCIIYKKIKKTSFGPYRLGDIIKGIYHKQNKIFMINYYYPIVYKNSIAAKYLKEIKYLPIEDKFNNIKILDKLTNTNKQFDIVLHLRLGDVIGDFNEKTNTFNQRAGNKTLTYFYQPYSYIKIAKKLNKMNFNKIYVFYASHTDDFDDNNKLYVKKIKNIFEQHNIEFIYSSTNNPDKDFTLMSNAKIFIKSGGGYSRLISKLVSYRGNQVITPEE